MKIGFIGLGQMGLPMASNLASKFSVTVFDKKTDDFSSLDKRGCIVATCLQEVAATEVIFLCLPNSHIVENVLFGEDGLVSHLSAGTIIVDTSTCEYEATVSFSTRLEKLGIEFIDAPISGMQKGAESGNLTMMCGGREELVKKLQSQFSLLASNVLYMGAVGTGQLMKMINNVIFDINLAALAEILPMAVKLGLDSENVGTVVNTGTGSSYASKFFIPRILKGGFEYGVSMDFAYKDLVHAGVISVKQKIPTPVLAAATSTYQQSMLAGHGGKDKGGMICIFEELLDVEFRAERQGQ